MKNLIVLICLIPFFISFHSKSQNQDIIIHSDSNCLLSKISKLTLEKIKTLKVCNNNWGCKGFITETDTSVINFDKINVRAIISSESEYSFKIQYKFRGSKDFLVGYYNLYCVNDYACLAFPKGDNQSILLEEAVYCFHSLPASTDERDVVYTIQKDDEFILYLKEE